VLRTHLPALDARCRAVIARSPFVLVGTANARGDCDVSSRGEGLGFVQILADRTLRFPDRPGNKRVAALRNVLENPHVVLLFIIPGMEETLRVNGRACLVRDPDPDLLHPVRVEGDAPALALGVAIDEAFLHCAKAFKRSRPWYTATWPDRAEMPAVGEMLMDQVRPTGITVQELDR
jgi:PPOX class probable FMN-dependent enzyme